MARTPSTMRPLQTPAPAFKLKDTHGRWVSLEDFKGRPLLVMFICNHCPYVQHLNDELVRLGKTYAEKGVAIVAISSNDVKNYPEDAPEKMAEVAKLLGYPFPYLYDETQEVARAYDAACTPDFFLYDAQHLLVYRGRLDGATPRNDVPVTGADLRRAMDDLLAGRPLTIEQIPSLGCNIKWA